MFSMNTLYRVMKINITDLGYRLFKSVIMLSSDNASFIIEISSLFCILP